MVSWPSDECREWVKGTLAEVAVHKPWVASPRLAGVTFNKARLSELRTRGVLKANAPLVVCQVDLPVDRYALMTAIPVRGGLEPLLFLPKTACELECNGRSISSDELTWSFTHQSRSDIGGGFDLTDGFRSSPPFSDQPDEQRPRQVTLSRLLVGKVEYENEDCVWAKLYVAQREQGYLVGSILTFLWEFYPNKRMWTCRDLDRVLQQTTEFGDEQ